LIRQAGFYRPPALPRFGLYQEDVWSMECTLFAMLYGASPLEAEAEFHTLSARESLENRGATILQSII